MPRRSRTNSDPARPISADELEAYAVRYLARFDCTAAKLRQVLQRRLGKPRAEQDEEGSATSHGGAATTGTPSPSAATPNIDRIVARFLEVGYLNDERFARGLAQSLLNRGTAPRKAIERLKQRGVSGELAEGVIREFGASGETELAAACRLVARKRLGWRRPDGVRQERAQKDLGALARAGFSFDVAKRALAAPPDEVE
jgi:regulatory protein